MIPPEQEPLDYRRRKRSPWRLRAGRFFVACVCLAVGLACLALAKEQARVPPPEFVSAPSPWPKTDKGTKPETAQQVRLLGSSCGSILFVGLAFGFLLRSFVCADDGSE